MTRLPSAPEQLLAVQLEQAGIPFEREVRFAPPRRWRADFAVWSTWGVEPGYRPADLLIEIDGGSYSGGHRRFGRFEDECDKGNAAVMLGYRVLHFTPAHVEDGRALATIKAALGLRSAA